MKPKTAIKNAAISFRTADAIKAALQRLAKKRKMTLSEYVAEVIANQMEK